ncbi:MAG: hypothetical protein ABFC34_14535 [Methanobacterium sp.]
MYDEDQDQEPKKVLNENLLAYLAGVYESRGNIIVQPQGGTFVSINGDYDFLLNIKNIIDVNSNIISTPNHHLQIYGELACEFLKKLYPYLISTRDQARLLFEYREHIKNRKGSRIDVKEQLYRSGAAKAIKNSKFEENIDFNHVGDWVPFYFIGVFDSKSKINIKKKNREYWLNIGLKLQNEELTLFLQQIYDKGYLYPTRDFIKWELNYEDAYNLLVNFNPYLIGKRKQAEIGIKFHKYFQDVEKPLKIKDVEFIEALRDDLKSLKKSSKSYGNKSVIGLLMCEDLIELMDQFIQSKKGLNYSSLVKSSISYLKYNESKLINFESQICKNKLKNYQLTLILENDILKFINKRASNRSEFIRTAVEVYLNDKFSPPELKLDTHTLKDSTAINKKETNNPLKLLKKIR